MPLRKVKGDWQWGYHGLAFDKATVRSFDKDGRLHIEVTPISKANVCPYYGREIPNYRSLGLQPDKFYYLLRDPKELAKAASTFNNIPLLSEHIPVTAADPQKMAVVGSTGTDAEFDGTYLKNSLVVWDADSIAGIETGEKKELSSAYRYVADMTPGVHEGQPYDGVMRDIVGNHVALVTEGRAGSDVVVGDSIPTGMKSMSELTKKLMAVITPMLASDEKPEEVEKKVQKVVEDEATQAGRDNESEAERLKREEDELKEREERERKEREERERKEREERERKEREERERKERDRDRKEAKDDDENKAAMDAALIRKAEENVMGRIRQANEARECVRALVGDVSLIAMDSAESIYRFALDSIGAEHKGVHPSALKSMVEFAISQKAVVRKPSHGMGMDSAATNSFAKAFPGATKLKRS
ncbi:DUF2213 domain-containing protein [Escherichia coli]|nr:DUF2213 domain-containing protein [Escherichia coli]